MATFTKNLSGDSRYSLKLEVNETSYSTENNTSEISYVLTATKSSGGGYWSSSAVSPVKVVINGETVVEQKPFHMMGMGLGQYLLVLIFVIVLIV